MPKSADQNQALKASSRAKLLAAALHRFARDGYAETSVKAVAQEAGVATGLLYSHFDGKEGLLRALFEQSMTDVRASFALADAAPPDQRLAALVRASVAIVREHFDFWRLGYAARTQPAVLAALGPALTTWTGDIISTLHGYLTELGSPEPAHDAQALFAQIDGMCQHYALDPIAYPIDHVAERVIARWSVPSPPRPED
jgi:AcrR family transcriptional regulator